MKHYLRYVYRILILSLASFTIFNMQAMHNTNPTGAPTRPDDMSHLNYATEGAAAAGNTRTRPTPSTPTRVRPLTTPRTPTTSASSSSSSSSSRSTPGSRQSVKKSKKRKVPDSARNDDWGSSDDEEDAPNANQENQNPNIRTPTLQGTFTRNPGKFKARLVNASPTGREKLLAEAQALTPYLSAMYVRSYRPDVTDDTTISPLKQVIKSTRKKLKTEVAKNIVRNLRENMQDAEHWSRSVTGSGIYAAYTVNQRDDLFTLDRVDDQNRTNRQRMALGLAPIGRDGSLINLHHWERRDPGPLGEVSGSLHRRESGPLHFVTQGVGPHRPLFDAFRRLYWQMREQFYGTTGDGVIGTTTSSSCSCT